MHAQQNVRAQSLLPPADLFKTMNALAADEGISQLHSQCALNPCAQVHLGAKIVQSNQRHAKPLIEAHIRALQEGGSLRLLWRCHE